MVMSPGTPSSASDCVDYNTRLFLFLSASPHSPVCSIEILSGSKRLQGGWRFLKCFPASQEVHPEAFLPILHVSQIIWHRPPCATRARNMADCRVNMYSSRSRGAHPSWCFLIYNLSWGQTWYGSLSQQDCQKNVCRRCDQVWPKCRNMAEEHLTGWTIAPYQSWVFNRARFLARAYRNCLLVKGPQGKKCSVLSLIFWSDHYNQKCAVLARQLTYVHVCDWCLALMDRVPEHWCSLYVCWDGTSWRKNAGKSWRSTAVSWKTSNGEP